MGLPLGMDVSGWQKEVDWQDAWNKGARFAYIKASEGSAPMNDFFGQQYNGAAGVGMIRGAYHFARPNLSSGVSQAKAFVQSGGGWSPDGKTLPGVLDLETNGSDNTGPCFGMSPSQLVAWTQDFTSTYKSMTGRDAVIYTAYYFWQDCMGGSKAFSQQNPLWIAAYGAPVTNVWMPGGWPQFSFWQYADAGTFAGDQNVWNGNLASLKQFATGTPPAVPVDLTTKLVSPGDFDADGKSDLIKRGPDGTLWFYQGDGAGKFGAGRKIGDFGWEIFDQVVGVGDFNGDGKNDLMARKLDGSLWFYAGTGIVSGSNNGYKGAVKVGDFGWEAFDSILGVGEFDGDGKPDLMARLPNGDLYLYSGRGTGKLGASRKIDFGWQIFNQLIAIKDFDGDGANDLAARKPDGTLWLYSNTGSAVLINGRQIGTGWNVYDSIVGTDDVNGDGMADFVGANTGGEVFFYAGTAMKEPAFKNLEKIGDFDWDLFDLLVGAQDINGDGIGDLLARKPDGTLWFYPGTGTGGYGAGRRIGDYGWEIFNSIVGSGDFNGDGKNDVIARGNDGTLWLYAGSGRVDSTSNGFLSVTKIGDYGWNIFDSLVGVGDFNGDAKNDILARQPDGTLWLYKGTGHVDSTSGGYVSAVKVGLYGWNIFDRLVGPGDVNGDGKSDLLARGPDGTLWLYAGDGSGNPGAARRIGSGWASYDLIVAAPNLTGDGNPALVARGPRGTLWRSAGTGMKPNEGYLGRTLALAF